jgi:hypothetical protein
MASHAIWRTLGRLLAVARGDERGLTVVEGVVAAFLLVLGALATLQVFDASTRTTFRAEESQVLNNRLQAELEGIVGLPYGQIAMTSSPGTSSNPNDPRWRVQGSSFALGRDGSDLRNMVMNGGAIPGGEETVEGGVLDPGPIEFSTGDISGEIFRFVVWTSDPTCADCGSGMMKRVIVAARVDEAPISFERRFQEIHTDVADPDATPDENPAPPGQEVDHSTASFWLTDTPCEGNQRLPVVEEPPDSGGHPAHNTRGLCSAGVRYGDERGAPDLMASDPPVLCDGCTIADQDLFDFASDVTGSTDSVGLTMAWPSTDSCLLESPLGTGNARLLLAGELEPLPDEPDEFVGLLDLPGADTSKHLRVHTWLSPPVAGEGGVLTGIATLDLYTRTISSQLYPGEICVSLFVRQPLEAPYDDGGGTSTVVREIDVPFVNVGSTTNQDGFVCSQELGQPFFRCHANQWPSSWSKVSVPMELEAVDSQGSLVPPELPPGSRVGVSVMVKEDGTAPAPGLEFMYDAVGFESRLELQTETIIPFG